MRPLEHPISPTDRVFFMHVPKTGGATLIQVIEEHFDECEIARWLYPSSVIEAKPDVFVEHRYFHGHVPYALIRCVLGADPVSLTMLRDPIDRFLSNWGNHQRVTKKEVPDVPQDQFEQLRRTRLDEFLLDPPSRVAPLAANFHDLHAKLLVTELDCARLRDLLPAFGDGTYVYPRPDLERAKRMLASLAFMGLTDRFQESLFLMAYTFGWAPVEEYRSVNVGPGRPRREELAPELLERLIDLNRLDLDLYDYGRQLFDTQYERMSWDLLERYGERADARLIPPPPTAVTARLLLAHYERRFVERNPVVPAVTLRFDEKISGTGWDTREHDPRHGIFRWSGPGSRATIDLPIAPGRCWLKISVAMYVTEAVLASLEVTVNDEALPLEKQRCESGAILFEGPITAQTLMRRPGCARIGFRIAHTVKPCTVITGSVDDRSLGIAVNWIEIGPARRT